MKKIVILMLLLLALSGCGQTKTAILVDEQSYSATDYPIDTVIVDGDSDNIILKASDENDISVRQYNSENSDEYFSDVEVSGTILTITEGKKPVGAYSRYVEIYIPASYQGTVCLTNKSGKITVDNSTNIFPSDFDVQTTSGKIEINGVESNYMQVTSSSGSIDISNCISPEMNVGSHSGKVSVTIPSITSFSISALTQTGSVQCDFLPETDSTGHSLTYNTESNPQYNFVLSSNSGVIEIDYSK